MNTLSEETIKKIIGILAGNVLFPANLACVSKSMSNICGDYLQLWLKDRAIIRIIAEKKRNKTSPSSTYNRIIRDVVFSQCKMDEKTVHFPKVYEDWWTAGSDFK